MSRRIPVKIKIALGEALAEWYWRFGKVAVRRAYHEEDDESTTDIGGAGSKPKFLEHPLLSELPLGAGSDLSNIPADSAYALDEAEQRQEELSNELAARLSLDMKKQHQKKYLYEYFTKPQVF